MTTAPTSQQLDEIAARATSERLTPGPWTLDREQCDCSDGYCHHGAYVTGVVTPVPTAIAAERCKRTGEQPRDYDFHRSEIGDFSEADWELMVHAREDVPVLLAEVRRLTAALTEMTHCRDNALRALYRDDVETDIDLEETIEAPFYGPGWDWDEAALQAVVKEAASAVRPAFGKLTQERNQLRARVAELEQTLPTCGRSWSTSGDEYPPCARPEDHPEAYCRSADGQSYFLAAPDPAP